MMIMIDDDDCVDDKNDNDYNNAWHEQMMYRWCITLIKNIYLILICALAEIVTMKFTTYL